MKAGDLVQWADHKDWSYKGLGFIIETTSGDGGRTLYKILWYVDIHDVGGHSGTWYDLDDFEEGTIVKL